MRPPPAVRRRRAPITARGMFLRRMRRRNDDDDDGDEHTYVARRRRPLRKTSLRWSSHEATRPRARRPLSAAATPPALREGKFLWRRRTRRRRKDDDDDDDDLSYCARGCHPMRDTSLRRASQEAKFFIEWRSQRGG